MLKMNRPCVYVCRKNGTNECYYRIRSFIYDDKHIAITCDDYTYVNIRLNVIKTFWLE